MKEDFGDFEEIQEDGTKAPTHTAQLGGPTRVRLPREHQFVGKVVQRLGGNRMEIKCSDGKTRNCRVPGRFKRSMWLRLGDTVLIELWEHDHEKADVIYKYNSSEIIQLKKRGLLDQITNEF